MDFICSAGCESIINLKELDCKHYICFDCMFNMCRIGAIKCPLCRKPHESKQIEENNINYFEDNIIESSTDDDSIGIVKYYDSESLTENELSCCDMTLEALKDEALYDNLCSRCQLKSLRLERINELNNCCNYGLCSKCRLRLLELKTAKFLKISYDLCVNYINEKINYISNKIDKPYAVQPVWGNRLSLDLNNSIYDYKVNINNLGYRIL